MSDVKMSSDNEKSAMLARLMGWQMGRYSNGKPCFRPPSRAPHGSYLHDLYDPENMQLAWRVLNWAEQYGDFYDWFYAYDAEAGDEINWIAMPPAEAQRLWLDKILELAVRAGMTKETP